MQMDVVAYLGPPASYSHQAARNAFPPSSYSLEPCRTIADVFNAVQSGSANHGLVPFENSTYGPVVATLDLFATALKNKHSSSHSTGDDAIAAHLRAYNNVTAVRDVFVPVKHCLLGKLPPDADEGITNGVNVTLPSLKHITLVQSHEQALGQCKNFLAADLPHAAKKEVSSTSRAAELAAADPTGATAAISSELAAEIYGLSILRKGIQDREDNVTRFLVLDRRREETEAQRSHGVLVPDVAGDGNAAAAESEGKNYKALVIFTVPHTSPGALADSLAVFKKHAVNLTSINTRPSGLMAWHYFFFVEVTSGGADGLKAGREKIGMALKELEGVAESFRCLGGWVSDEFGGRTGFEGVEST